MIGTWDAREWGSGVASVAVGAGRPLRVTVDRSTSTVMDWVGGLSAK